MIQNEGKKCLLREKKLTQEHDVHHHELLEKQDPSDPHYHLHKPNQSFSQPSTLKTQTKMTRVTIVIMTTKPNQARKKETIILIKKIKIKNTIILDYINID